MSLLRGEDLNLGVGMEDPTSRGTIVTPQGWVPARTPTGINIEVVKTLIKETKASGIMSQGSEVVQRKAVGSLEFNLKSEMIGYILKSLIGQCDTASVYGTVNSHTFEILPNDPQFPTISLALSQPNMQDYGYKGAIIKSLEIRTPVDDLVNATVEFEALDEEEKSNYTPAFVATDYMFRPQDVEIKLATNIAGLGAAEAINTKEFSLKINNNGRAQQHIGSVTPTDMIANLLEIAGNIVLDYEGDTYHDLYKDGSYRAMQISLTRSDIDLEGGYNPSIIIQLAKVSFESSSPDRPMDDIVRDSLEFTAHYSADDSEAINVVLQNTVADYLKD